MKKITFLMSGLALALVTRAATVVGITQAAPGAPSLTSEMMASYACLLLKGGTLTKAMGALPETSQAGVDAIAAYLAVNFAENYESLVTGYYDMVRDDNKMDFRNSSGSSFGDHFGLVVYNPVDGTKSGVENIASYRVFNLDNKSAISDAAPKSGYWSDWQVVASVPEPTSGLLVLLGVAGLALRRKGRPLRRPVRSAKGTATLCLMLALLAVSRGASAGDFRWGGSNKNNKVKYNNSYAYLASGNCRVFLYLGEARVVNNQVSLEGLTYVCDATAKSSGDSSFGNHYATDAYLSSDLVSSAGGQAFSLIAVSLYKPTKVTAGQAIEPGDYYSVAVKTGTSVSRTDGEGRAYASLVLDAVFANADYSNPGAFVKSVEPVSDGGYLWGSSAYNGYRVPNCSTGASTALNGASALTYLYLGKAEFRNGVVNLGKLTYLTNSTPQASGCFGNYTTTPVASKLIQDDRVNPNGGQDFTILVVTPDRSGKLPPKALPGGYAANYIAIQTGTSASAVTGDGARHAQFVSDTPTTVKDFVMTVPLVDVDGATFSVH